MKLGPGRAALLPAPLARMQPPPEPLLQLGEKVGSGRWPAYVLVTPRILGAALQSAGEEGTPMADLAARRRCRGEAAVGPAGMRRDAAPGPILRAFGGQDSLRPRDPLATFESPRSQAFKVQSTTLANSVPQPRHAALSRSSIWRNVPVTFHSAPESSSCTAFLCLSAYAELQDHGCACPDRAAMIAAAHLRSRP